MATQIWCERKLPTGVFCAQKLFPMALSAPLLRGLHHSLSEHLVRSYLIDVGSVIMMNLTAKSLFDRVKEKYPNMEDTRIIRLCVVEFFPDVNDGGSYPSPARVIRKIETEYVHEKASAVDVQTAFTAIVRILHGRNTPVVMMPYGTAIHLATFAKNYEGDDPESVLRVFIKSLDAAHILSIKRLFIVGSEMRVMPEPMRLLTNITSVSFNNCKLGKIPRWIGEWKALRIFISNRNPIKQLPMDMFGLNLTYLEINKGELTTISRWIGRAEALKKVKFPDNNITLFPRDDMACDKIQGLMVGKSDSCIDVSNNPIPAAEYARLWAVKPLGDQGGGSN